MPGMTMDAVFVTLGKEDLYPIVRDDLYFFLAFLLVCGVAILITMSTEADAEPRRPSGGGVAAEQRQGGGSPAFHPEPIVQAWEQPASPGVQQAVQEPALRGARQAAEEPALHGVQQAVEGPSRALTSPRTGLVWAEYLEPRLKAELDRAASSDQDLSMALIRIDEPAADGRLSTVYVEIAKMLKQSFPIHDLIFETGDDSYAVIMPDADVDASLRMLEELRKKLIVQPIEGRPRTLSIGVSSRGGRLVDDHVLREEAGVALAKASREGGNQVIGFRADAARFRETLTGKMT
jgi:GGDEF domain-containing protein